MVHPKAPLSEPSPSVPLRSSTSMPIRFSRPVANTSAKVQAKRHSSMLLPASLAPPMPPASVWIMSKLFTTWVAMLVAARAL